jgi:hypothetical protein
MKKINIKKLIKEIKGEASYTKSVKPPVARVEKQYRERDMRKESIDMGAHGAKEFFGGKNG